MWNNMDSKEISNLLNELPFQEVLFLTYDYFPQVYARLSRKTTPKELVELLVKYCPAAELLVAIKEIAPHKIKIPLLRLDHDAAKELKFRLQIQQFNGQPFVQVLYENETAPEPFKMPFTTETWSAIAKALRIPIGMVDEKTFDEHERQLLIDEKIIGGKSGKPTFLLRTLYQKVGERLYGALLPPKAREAFKIVLATAQRENKTVTFQLIFDKNATVEAAYPWELLADDGQFLLSTGYVNLTRYIAFNQPTPSLEADLPIRVLFIPSHPSDQVSLGGERGAVVKGLGEQINHRQVKFEVISSPTRQELFNCLLSGQYDYVHFDGHGMFGYLCPSCGELCEPTLTECSNCGYPFDESPQGYLVFEKADGKSDFVSAETLRNIFARSNVKLVVLSACWSGSVGGGTIFGGAGPSLIQVGVPAVVSMQLPVAVGAAVRYFQQFYKTLADGQGVLEAVRRGRQLLQDDQANPQTWFIPTLYLRYKS